MRLSGKRGGGRLKRRREAYGMNQLQKEMVSRVIE